MIIFKQNYHIKFMKFIFPQNYNFNVKFLGFIDYTTLILNIIWGLIIFLFVYFLIPNITFKIGIFIILFLPFFLLSIIGFNHEKILYILKYLIKYLFSPQVYLYRKNYHNIEFAHYKNNGILKK